MPSRLHIQMQQYRAVTSTCVKVLRKISEVSLKVIYENNYGVRIFVRCLAALAYVPPDDVLEVYDILAENKPQTDDETRAKLDELLTYFEHTYVRGRRLRGCGDHYGPPLFAVGLLTKHAAGVDGLACTTNITEDFHYGIQALFQCHHLNTRNFLKGITADVQKQKTKFLLGISGLSEAGSRRYERLNARIMAAVTGHGRAEVLQYLRTFAQLSFS